MRINCVESYHLTFFIKDADCKVMILVMTCIECFLYFKRLQVITVDW